MEEMLEQHVCITAGYNGARPVDLCLYSSCDITENRSPHWRTRKIEEVPRDVWNANQR